MAGDNTPSPMDGGNTTIESRKDFQKNAAGLQKRWTTEIDTAESDIKKFWRRANSTLPSFITIKKMSRI